MFEISNIGILTALAAGAISFLSPCVLPVVPGYISYMIDKPVVGRPYRALDSRLSILLLGTLLAPSVSTVFVTLGAAR
ncbi:cytochrome c biogenesis protein CcdA [Mesorhizobium sangaii]|uniref:Cytochrome c biogenesis protein CcdA n=1 Tax=Mesorhizobium sangaii TaxID=505389 RepID=A0A841PGX9_9HYPH|nr:cytochrome c biogenesis protein CcdA [Mesorhizobium sangaii]